MLNCVSLLREKISRFVSSIACVAAR